MSVSRIAFTTIFRAHRASAALTLARIFVAGASKMRQAAAAWCRSSGASSQYNLAKVLRRATSNVFECPGCSRSWLKAAINTASTSMERRHASLREQATGARHAWPKYVPKIVESSIGPHQAMQQ